MAAQSDTFGPDPDPDWAYYRDMADQDAFGVVIRAGAYIDHELIRLNEMAVVQPEALKHLHLDYAGRCALAVALGLEARFHPPLKSLGAIRNKLAHDPRSTLTANDANNLYKAFAPEEKEIVVSRFDKVVSDRGEKRRRFADQPPLDRFVMMAITLRAALRAGQRQLQHILASSSAK